MKDCLVKILQRAVCWSLSSALALSASALELTEPKNPSNLLTPPAAESPAAESPASAPAPESPASPPPPTPPPALPPPGLPIPNSRPPEPTPPPQQTPSGGELDGQGQPTVREIKREVIPMKGAKAARPQALPDLAVTPGSIRKILIVIAVPNVPQKVIMNAIQKIRSQFKLKFLIVQSKSSAEISHHITTDSKLTFDTFSESVRANFPFKEDERMVYIVNIDVIRSVGSAPMSYLTNPRQGVGVISLANLPLDQQDSALGFAKVLKIIAARFYNTSSTCGVLAEGSNLEALQNLPEDYCAEDKEILKAQQLLP